MSIKRKPTLEQLENKEGLNDNEKRVRSESNISHSSWIYRLTATPTKTEEQHNKEENLEQEEQEEQKPEQKPEQVSVTIENPTNSTEQVVEEEEEPIKAQQQNASSQGSGIWSWLGYSGPQPTTAASDPKPSDNNDEKTIPVTAAIEQEKQEVQIVSDKSTTNETATHHRSTASAAPKPSYWKSLFSSSAPELTNADNNQDSVIISDDNSEEQPPEQPPIEQSNTTPDNLTVVEDDNSTTQKLPIPPSRHNVVLPTFKSQFHASSSSIHSNQDNSNIFSKAINAINSIFTQKPNKPINSDWQDVHYLSTMIDSMKNDPEHVAGKKIVIIGVHGWFPMKLVRSVVGEPTGTSTKFCEQMTAAVKKYFSQTHDLNIPDEAITNIPLQWEGKVLERVNKLYDYLISDWKQMIESADVILWTTHSQGTPVSAILLRKLIEENIIQVDRQPICMLAMAGISHGPFPSLKGSLLVKYFEADAARELFEFMDSNSDISVQYREAMAFILQNKIKTVLVGSMQDQVVPLYSAIMSGISHPNILRAIYIDGHIYTKDDFLIRLITFALRLLNVGLSDHGFLIHISEVLAGNIYSWEGGHSTVYEELDVFMLPLQYMFETSPFGNLEVLKPASLLTQQLKDSSDRAKQNVLDKVKARLDPFQAKLRLNPFHLPWAMRGIWDDPRILGDETLSHELDKLQDLFDKWNPTSARLKEIKFRLEPLKARL